MRKGMINHGFKLAFCLSFVFLKHIFFNALLWRSLNSKLNKSLFFLFLNALWLGNFHFLYFLFKIQNFISIIFKSLCSLFNQSSVVWSNFFKTIKLFLKFLILLFVALKNLVCFLFFLIHHCYDLLQLKIFVSQFLHFVFFIIHELLSFVFFPLVPSISWLPQSVRRRFYWHLIALRSHYPLSFFYFWLFKSDRFDLAIRVLCKWIIRELQTNVWLFFILDV